MRASETASRSLATATSSRACMTYRTNSAVPGAGDAWLEPGDGMVVLAPLDQVRADIVVGVAEGRVHGDGFLALGDGFVDLALIMIGPAQEGMGFGGGMQLDGSLVELGRQVEIALHLQLVGVLKQFPGHFESRVGHADVVYVTR